jgi:hypothetical protein
MHTAERGAGGVKTTTPETRLTEYFNRRERRDRKEGNVFMAHLEFTARISRFKFNVFNVFNVLNTYRLDGAPVID